MFVGKGEQRVGVITDESNLVIEVLLSLGPGYTDEHSMEFPSLSAYEAVEYDIMMTLKDKGFVMERG